MLERSKIGCIVYLLEAKTKQTNRKVLATARGGTEVADYQSDTRNSSKNTNRGNT